MIDLLIGLAFIAMIITPAIAATLQHSHNDESEGIAPRPQHREQSVAVSAIPTKQPESEAVVALQPLQHDRDKASA